ncbi:DUF192 domain-containing protein [uncultured Cohaesibacter sp.]|uniref:DUF192 domain-containing protein n=1 Tax=uncultured Cohaesibacter sp. TaxID=1002546 RepID=UPI0029C96162|nr:DUF192 domain-containing protein [uncultured Cohaesibacter sp.]
MPKHSLTSFLQIALTFLIILAFQLAVSSPIIAADKASANKVGISQSVAATNTDALNEDQLEHFLSRSDHLAIATSTGNHPFTVELALSDAARAKGLMHRTEMADDHGMLFDFGETAPVYMWMKNTYISLDMLFITDEGKIHHIVTGTTPLSQSIIGSGGSVRYVLEVKKGTVARTGVRPGDFIKHQLFTPDGLK